MIVAGVGFRHGTPGGEIAGLVRRALSAAGLAEGELGLLATAQDRSAEAGFQAAAAELGANAIGIAADDLRAVDEHVPTRSERILASRGIGSVAEAAALCGAGSGAILVLNRMAEAHVTCALARGAGR